MTHREFWEDTYNFYHGHPERRAVEGGACAYLTEDGRKCAIGRHIPDGHRGQHSHQNVIGLFRGHPDLRELPAFAGLDVDFLLAVQGWHDGCCDDSIAKIIESALDYLEPRP